MIHRKAGKDFLEYDSCLAAICLSMTRLETRLLLPLLAGPDMFRLLKVCSSSSKPLSGCAAKSEHKLEWRNDLHPFIVKELGPCELEWQGILPCPSNFPKS